MRRYGSFGESRYHACAARLPLIDAVTIFPSGAGRRRADAVASCNTTGRRYQVDGLAMRLPQAARRLIKISGSMERFRYCCGGRCRLRSFETLTMLKSP